MELRSRYLVLRTADTHKGGRGILPRTRPQGRVDSSSPATGPAATPTSDSVLSKTKGGPTGRASAAAGYVLCSERSALTPQEHIMTFDSIKSAITPNDNVKNVAIVAGGITAFAALWAASCAITVAVGDSVIDLVS